MTDFDWPPEALDRLRAEVLKHAGVPLHRADVPVDSCRLGRSLLRLFVPFDDHACSVHRAGRLRRGEGRHRAPKHRADRHEDSCGLACGYGGVACGRYVGRRRADVAA